jgi:TrmH family RNA methyltransferase
METPLITSVQNPRVKQVVLLQQKSSERRKQGLFVVEGARELSHCLSHGYEADSLFVCDELLPSSSSLQEVLPSLEPSRVFHVSLKVYAKMAYRESTEGVLALLKSRVQSLERLGLGPNPLIVVLESVEKPGNLGAILRSADASGADAVVVCDPLTDLYNPNLIRSSIGALFTVPCVACSSEDCIHFLKERGIQILTAQLQDSELYYDTPMTGPTAIVMGTESTGLTPQWRDAADRHIRIPMLGSLDSLNVSVSTAILLYEAVRQRRR